MRRCTHTSGLDPRRRHARARRRGFNLIEVAAAAAILAVLAALGLSALGNLRDQGAFTAAANEVQATLLQLRAEAYARGIPTVLVVDSKGGRMWAIADSDGNFSITAFNPDQPIPSASPDRLLGKVELDKRVTIGPADGYGEPLPAPLAAIPAQAACSFCVANASGKPGFGAIVFQAGAGASFQGPATPPVGGTITFKQATGQERSPITVAVNGRTGNASSFTRKKQ